MTDKKPTGRQHGSRGIKTYYTTYFLSDKSLYNDLGDSVGIKELHAHLKNIIKMSRAGKYVFSLDEMTKAKKLYNEFLNYLNEIDDKGKRLRQPSKDDVAILKGLRDNFLSMIRIADKTTDENDLTDNQEGLIKSLDRITNMTQTTLKRANYGDKQDKNQEPTDE